MKADILPDRILPKIYSALFSSLLPAGTKGRFLVAQGCFLPLGFRTRSTADWRLVDATDKAAEVLGVREVVST